MDNKISLQNTVDFGCSSEDSSFKKTIVEKKCVFVENLFFFIYIYINISLICYISKSSAGKNHSFLKCYLLNGIDG